MKISHGSLVICADDTKAWYGWIGVVRGKNVKHIGIDFEEDPEDPPKATGRWIPKDLVVALDDPTPLPPKLKRAVSRYRQWSTLLRKARDSALLAVETYNRPTANFRTGSYASLMIIAWTSLLLAIIVKRGDSPYELDPTTKKPKKNDGEYKFIGIWDCIRECFGANDQPTVNNLTIFVKIRNKIEHADVPGLEEKFLAETQALLRNFERVIRSNFGQRFGLNSTLAFPVTFSYAPPSTALEVLRAKSSDETKSVFDFIDQFRANLDPDVLDSQEYSFRVFMLPRVGAHRGSADVAVTWVDVDNDDPTDVAEANRSIAALLKIKHVEVQNHGRHRPGAVAAMVSEELGVRFSSSTHHSRCCVKLGAWKTATRPKSAEDCDNRYCVFNVSHGDFLYTEAWVRKLVSTLSTLDGQEEVIGKPLELLTPAEST